MMKELGIKGLLYIEIDGKRIHTLEELNEFEKIISKKSK